MIFHPFRDFAGTGIEQASSGSGLPKNGLRNFSAYDTLCVLKRKHFGDNCHPRIRLFYR